MLATFLFIAVQVASAAAPVIVSDPQPPPVPAREAREQTPQVQPPPSPGEPRERESRPRRPFYEPVVIQLKYADCMEVAAMLSRFNRDGEAFPIERTNSVVFSGPPETLPVVRKVIQEIDVPAAEVRSTDLQVLPVQHRDPSDLAAEIGGLLGGREFRIAADSDRSALLVRGPQAAIDAARSALEQLDRPTGRVEIEFVFFHADFHASASGTGQAPHPTDLQAVVSEIERFGSIELLGRLAAVAVEREEFLVTGNVGSDIRARIAGAPDRVSPNGTVAIKVQAHLVLMAATPPPAEGDEKVERSVRGGEFQIDTSVLVQRGDWVVIGSAPAGWSSGQSAILAMQVKP